MRAESTFEDVSLNADYLSLQSLKIVKIFFYPSLAFPQLFRGMEQREVSEKISSVLWQNRPAWWCR